MAKVNNLFAVWVGNTAFIIRWQPDSYWGKTKLDERGYRWRVDCGRLSFYFEYYG